MKASELTYSDKEAILKTFRQGSTYQNLLKQQRKSAAKGQVKRAADMAEYILKAEKMYVEEYCKQFAEKCAGARELSEMMEKEDFEKLSKQWHLVNLLTDMLNARLFDMRSLLEKYKDTFVFNGYMDLLKIGNLLKEKVDYTTDTRTEKVNQLYVDTICSIEDYLSKRTDTMIKRLADLDEKYKRQVEREHRAELRKQNKATA